MPTTPMVTQLVLEWFVAISVMVIGISHMVRPSLWVELFSDLLQKSYGGLVIGTLTLPLGLAVALGHNTWSWHASSIVTLLGWGWTIKGGLYLLWPSLPQKVAKEHLKRPRRFAYAGMGIALLGTIVLVNLMTRADRTL